MDYLKTTGIMFFKWAICCGIVLGIYGGISKGILGIIPGVGIGVGVGILFTVLTIGADTLFRIIEFIKYRNIHFHSNVFKKVPMDLDDSEMHEICKISLESIKDIKDIKCSIDGRKFIGTYQKTWRSSGEKIEIDIETSNSNRYVSIRSTPLKKTSMFDFGKGIENTELVSRSITKYSTMQLA